MFKKMPLANYVPSSLIAYHRDKIKKPPKGIRHPPGGGRLVISSNPFAWLLPKMEQSESAKRPVILY
jgi:hypothetical protein